MYEDIRKEIELAWEDRSLLGSASVKEAIRETISLLDEGKIRVAERSGSDWVVNQWIKKGVILYFPIQQMSVIEAGPFEFHDKIAL